VLKSPAALLSRRGARIAGQAVVITSLIGGTAAYALADTTVELTVDGRTEKVRTFGSKVSNVLESADVELGPHDVVAPAPGESVEDGGQVVVRHARELTLTVDGETQSHWTTALTVGEALEALNVRATGARMSASRSMALGRDGLDLEINNPKNVQILVDDQVLPVVTQAATVGDVLAEAGVKLAGRDSVSVPPATPAVDGLSVAVTRIATDALTEEKSVAFETEERKTDDLYEDQKKVETKGKAGVLTITYEQVTANGKEIARRKLTEQVTTKPVTQVVLVGTKERPAPAQTTTAVKATASGSTWDRLAQCESGGNWHINTGNGYYGGLQFSLSTWRGHGGSGMPHQNSREQQIAIAERVKASQGWGAWPACTRKLGLR
jgi:uncharacterized protein YabE (DUF348 family)